MNGPLKPSFYVLNGDRSCMRPTKSTSSQPGTTASLQGASWASTQGARCLSLVLWWFSGWWWLEPWNFMTFHSVGNVMIPSEELIFFRGVGQPPTSFCCSLEQPGWCLIINRGFWKNHGCFMFQPEGFFVGLVTAGFMAINYPLKRVIFNR